MIGRSLRAFANQPYLYASISCCRQCGLAVGQLNANKQLGVNSIGNERLLHDLEARFGEAPVLGKRRRAVKVSRNLDLGGGHGFGSGCGLVDDLSRGGRQLGAVVSKECNVIGRASRMEKAAGAQSKRQ